jgi:uncharacterized protein
LGEKGIYVSHGILCVEATAAACLHLRLRSAKEVALRLEVITEGVRCIRNGLIGLGMIDGARVAPKANYVMRESAASAPNAAVFSSLWRNSAS